MRKRKTRTHIYRTCSIRKEKTNPAGRVPGPEMMLALALDRVTSATSPVSYGRGNCPVGVSSSDS